MWKINFFFFRQPLIDWEDGPNAFTSSVFPHLSLSNLLTNFFLIQMTWPNIYLAHCQRLNFLAKAGVSARGSLFKKFFWIKNSPTSTTFLLFSSCSILQSLWKAGVSGSRPFLILFLIRRYKKSFLLFNLFFCDLAFPPFFIFWWRHQVWVAGDIYHWLFKLG